LRDGVPLLRRRIEPDISIRRGPHPVVDDFNPAHLGITEEIVVPVAEDQNIEATGLEVLEIVQLENLDAIARLIRSEDQDGKQSQAEEHGHPMLSLNRSIRFSADPELVAC
jgi:hypothetical protein